MAADLPQHISKGPILLTRLIKKILRTLGFDRAVTFGILAQSWSLISGPITMVVIATGLSALQQGFYFTFSSLLALQTFFDLGLMFVIAQFATHEFVGLSWGPNGTVKGEPLPLKRFTDLVCKTTLWFGVAGLLMSAVLIPAGLIFFAQKGSVPFPWRLPWILAVIGTSLNLCVMPFFAIIMGSGDVVTVNKRELLISISSSIVCWIVICSHGGLFAAFAVNLGVLTISWGYLLTKRRELVKLALRGWLGEQRAARKDVAGLSWWHEIWPMQWRMAVSSGSAYFIFQLFNPILFHYHGSVVAGQMGMTLTAANALAAGSMTVVQTKMPEFGRLVAVRDWRGLDKVFKHAYFKAVLLAAIGVICGTAAVWFLQSYFPSLGRRFLPAGQAFLLFATALSMNNAGALANYLRAHKKEPLMRMTLFSSIFQGLATWYLGKNYGSLGATAGYFLVTTFFTCPYCLIVWIRCRKLWHSEAYAFE